MKFIDLTPHIKIYENKQGNKTIFFEYDGNNFEVLVYKNFAEVTATTDVQFVKERLKFLKNLGYQ